MYGAKFNGDENELYARDALHNTGNALLDSVYARFGHMFADHTVAGNKVWGPIEAAFQNYAKALVYNAERDVRGEAKREFIDAYSAAPSIGPFQARHVAGSIADHVAEYKLEFNLDEALGRIPAHWPVSEQAREDLRDFAALHADSKSGRVILPRALNGAKSQFVETYVAGSLSGLNNPVLHDSETAKAEACAQEILRDTQRLVDTQLAQGASRTR